VRVWCGCKGGGGGFVWGGGGGAMEKQSFKHQTQGTGTDDSSGPKKKSETHSKIIIGSERNSIYKVMKLADTHDRTKKKRNSSEERENILEQTLSEVQH